jgi:hypothetical protein
VWPTLQSGQVRKKFTQKSGIRSGFLKYFFYNLELLLYKRAYPEMGFKPQLKNLAGLPEYDT